MYCLLKLLAFACCVITSAAVCNLSKYNQGPRDWLKCFSSSISEVTNGLQTNLIAVSVSQSVIQVIPNAAFDLRASTVEILNFHDCGINRIEPRAFRGLTSLKTLSLSYNNIKNLNDSWLSELQSLEQLDVSFNKITNLDSSIYYRLLKLQRLDLNDNLLTCVSTLGMENLRQLRDIRIQENPLSYICRAQLTLWLKDHKVSYTTNEDNFIWLDGILWQCLSNLEDPKSTTQAAKKKMNICVISNMFDQLATVLGVSPSFTNSITECSSYRRELTQCLNGQSDETKKNGAMLSNLLALTQDTAKLEAQ